jgi:hypothetical protein
MATKWCMWTGLSEQKTKTSVSAGMHKKEEDSGEDDR